MEQIIDTRISDVEKYRKINEKKTLKICGKTNKIHKKMCIRRLAEG